MNKLVVDLLQQKGLGCWKVLKKGVNRKEKCFLSSQTRWSWQSKEMSMHLVQNMFIFTKTLVIYARTIFKPRCYLNFQSMRTQAEITDIAHNMFGQIKMKIPWYNCRHTLISRKRDGKPRMIGGQFVVVRVGVHQLISVSPNTSHPMLQICSKLLHGNSMPSLNSSYIQLTSRSPWKALSNWAVQQALERGCKLRSAWTTLRKVSLMTY